MDKTLWDIRVIRQYETPVPCKNLAVLKRSLGNQMAWMSVITLVRLVDLDGLCKRHKNMGVAHAAVMAKPWADQETPLPSYWEVLSQIIYLT